MKIATATLKARDLFWQGVKITTGHSPVARRTGRELFDKIFTTDPTRMVDLFEGPKGKALLEYDVYQVQGQALERLGLNLSMLKGGAQVWVLNPEEYAKYCKVVGLDPSRLAGVYCPRGGRQLQLLNLGLRATMDDEFRVAVVPDDTSLLTICHELTHDIFMNPKVDNPIFSRDFFAQVVISQIKLAKKGSAAEAFFQAITERCAPPYELERARDLNNLSVGVKSKSPAYAALPEDAQKYLGEVFAYSASILALNNMTGGVGERDPRLLRVPKEISEWFETNNVFKKKPVKLIEKYSDRRLNGYSKKTPRSAGPDSILEKS